MKVFRFCCLFLLLAFGLPQPPGETFCGITNTAFQAGETVSYKIYYTLAGMYLEAGKVSFTCRAESFNGKAVFHIIAVGQTLPFYDNFYKVRDRYETFLDSSTLEPYKFVRNVQEGDLRKYEIISFNKAGGTAITNTGVYKVPPCVVDVLGAVYNARNLNFDSRHPGDKIPFSMFLDNQVFTSYIRYMGREVIKTKYGKFHAIKFRPLLIKGTMFQAGENMTVWVSDDANHIPLRVESPITVGSVKADMMEFVNRRTPMSALLPGK